MNTGKYATRAILLILCLILVMQIYLIFRRPSERHFLKSVRSEIARIDSSSAQIEKRLIKIINENDSIDLRVEKSIASQTKKMEEIRKALSSVRSKSRSIQSSVDSLCDLMENTPSPRRLPTLEELQKK